MGAGSFQEIHADTDLEPSRVAAVRRELSGEVRRQLETWVRMRTATHRIVLRSRIVLLADEGLQPADIARRLDVAPATARLWLRRFYAGGPAAIATEAKGRGRPSGIARATTLAVLRITADAGPLASVREVARAAGVSASTTWRVWAHCDVRHNRAPAAVQRAMRKVIAVTDRKPG
jgi:transposase-like protein